LKSLTKLAKTPAEKKEKQCEEKNKKGKMMENDSCNYSSYFEQMD
jgi:hypothetical protein